MWVDPMLLAMNWGAALLMALGLGIVYWHATRDTGQLSSSMQALRLEDIMACVCEPMHVWCKVCAHVWCKVCAHVWCKVCAHVWYSVCAHVWCKVCAHVWYNVCAHLWCSVAGCQLLC